MWVSTVVIFSWGLSYSKGCHLKHTSKLNVYVYLYTQIRIQNISFSVAARLRTDWGTSLVVQELTAVQRRRVWLLELRIPHMSGRLSPCPTTTRVHTPQPESVCHVSRIGRRVLYHWATWEPCQIGRKTERCKSGNPHKIGTNTSAGMGAIT